MKRGLPGGTLAVSTEGAPRGGPGHVVRRFGPVQLIEAATHAARHPLYREHDERTKRRLGKQRGPKVARVELARKLAEAIWFMLTRDEDFAPAGPTRGALVA